MNKRKKQNAKWNKAIAVTNAPDEEFSSNLSVNKLASASAGRKEFDISNDIFATVHGLGLTGECDNTLRTLQQGMKQDQSNPVYMDLVQKMASSYMQQKMDLDSSWSDKKTLSYCPVIYSML